LIVFLAVIFLIASLLITFWIGVQGAVFQEFLQRGDILNKDKAAFTLVALTPVAVFLAFIAGKLL